MNSLDYNEFIKKYSVKLNEQQSVAVKTTQGAVLLLAVPGSGKTTVLVTRLGYMIFAKGVLPENILTMTYTVAATKDMRMRFESMFGCEMAKRLNFSTINSVSCQIIRCFERTLGRKAFELISSETEINGIIGEIYRKVIGTFAQEGDIKNIRLMITYAKNMLLSDEEIIEFDNQLKCFSKIYKEYCDTLLNMKKMDFDDQMVYAYKILRTHPEILSYFRNKYKYICVDEAQDTSKIQHIIIKYLTGENGNIFMVGDEDQSIYGFRAAYPEALMNFEKLYKNAKVLMLETNYRSTVQIVSNADSFIKRNKVRRQKNMKAALGQGNDIRSVKFKNRIQQYEYISRIAEENKENTAILYRDNDSVIPIIDLLERKGIPYLYKGNDSSFFTHPVVKDVEDIINFAFDLYNGELFMRIYYKFNKGISKADAINAVKISRQKNIPVIKALLKYCELSKWCMGNVRELEWNFEMIQKCSACETMNRIIRYSGYSDYLDSRCADKSKLDILQAVAENSGSSDDLLRRLKELEVIVKKGSFTECNFVLSTIHSAKGLEYDNVIIIDVTDDLFPKTDGCFSDKSKSVQLEEERRLFYVGITRAKKNLTLFEYEDCSSIFTSHFFPKLKTENALTESKYKVSLTKGKSFSDFSDGDFIIHKKFGKGQINEIRKSVAEIYFYNYGIKYIDIEVAESSGIIKKFNKTK